jgi:putative membrane protein
LRLLTALALLLMLLVISGWHPYDRLTWWLEVLPILLALPILICSYRAVPLTGIAYGVVFAMSAIMMIGGAYSYARVPLGFEIQQLLSLQRNPYDKLGHFMQGVIGCMLAREALLRGRFVRDRIMLGFLIIAVALAISAAYELFEWASALALGQAADDFLGTQGDPWDTQSDMLWALGGACTAVLTLSRAHDRQSAALDAMRLKPMRLPD